MMLNSSSLLMQKASTVSSYVANDFFTTMLQFSNDILWLCYLYQIIFIISS